MPEQPIVHVDIPGQDPEVAARFYAEMFGWQLQPIPSMQYIRFRSPNGVTGGFVGLGGPEQYRVGELLVYVASDDVDRDLKRAEQLGAKIVVAKTEIPRTGSYGILEDPAGNRIGLFHRTGYVNE